jgi:hypothetical protein
LIAFAAFIVLLCGRLHRQGNVYDAEQSVQFLYRDESKPDRKVLRDSVLFRGGIYMASEIDVLTARVARLEDQNRRLKLIGVGIVLASMGLVSMGLSGKPRTIEAEKIVVLDSHGRARVTIGTPEAAGIAVAMKPDAPGIWLSDEHGTDRTILTADGLRIGDSGGKPRAELSTEPSRSALRFYGPDGKVSWSAP